MDPVPEERFAELVDAALDDVPDDLWAQFDNVAVVIDDAHPDEPDLLGIYEGIPLTDRGDYFGVLPDRIVIYRLPLCEMCADEAELIHEVRVTVVHELAHHMGIDDDHLDRLGWE
ncbi:MAG TPA: metallopeptidase family protein [Egibacteraceae bacterium]|nr:metallopeptidase family protein [Egibacteraceae bacterium]